MSRDGFDCIAPFYDLLARLIFGSSIEKAQRQFLDVNPPAKQILVLGGGTGAFLATLRSAHPHATIYFIDASAQMIRIAKHRNKAQQIQFIHGTENDIPANLSFDIVITNFYLDLFESSKLASVIDLICRSLHSRSTWIASDFTDRNRWWQRLMLSFMYFFFRLTCGVTTQSLPDWRTALKKAGWKKQDERHFYSGFIESGVFRFGTNNLY
jgi:tRNA (cmo5U34)-methyltransferase